MEPRGWVIWWVVSVPLLLTDVSQLLAQMPESTVASRSEPPKTFALEGVCIDEEQRPLAGVELELILRKGVGDLGTTLATQQSRADGTFQFAGLTHREPTEDLSHSYYLIGRSPGRSSAILVYPTSTPVVPTARLQFTARTARFVGRVIDSQGRPVQSAFVTKIPIGRWFCGSIYAAETDENGRFVIEDLASEEAGPEFAGHALRPNQQFRVYHPDYPMTPIRYTGPKWDGTVTLDSGIVVEGRVRDAVLDRPAAGILVQARGLIADNFAWGVTGDDGRFQIRMLPDTYVFRAMTDDRASSVVKEFRVSRDQPPAKLELSLIEGGFVEGSVIDAKTRRPLTTSALDAPLQVVLHETPLPRAGHRPVFAIVKRDGAFRVRVAPGEYTFGVQGAHSSVEITPRTLAVKDGETAELSIALQIGRDGPRP